MSARVICKLLGALALVSIAASGPALQAADAGTTTRASPVGIGDVAPDFTLGNQDGNKRTLSAGRGKRPVVPVFYRGHR